MRIYALFASLLSALTLSAQPARAEWFEARTTHFNLITDASEERARDFSSRLELFDAALRRLYGISDNPDLHNRPVTIYALDPLVYFAVCRCRGSLGHYSRPVSGPRILVMSSQKADAKLKSGDLDSQALMLHEYSHHFMFTNFPGAYPYWYVEGFAEFNANVAFRQDGSVVVGFPANYRGQALLGGSRLPLRKLVAPEQYGFGDNGDLIYGRAWLLTHYLMLRPERAGQLGRYLAAMRGGKPSLAAAQTAFGDFTALDRELDAYMKGNLAPPLKISLPVAPAAASIRRLGKGEQAILISWLLMTDGVEWGYRKGPAMDAEKTARAYADDPVVQRRAAEVSLLADRLDQANTSADRAIALEPASSEALVLKGRIAALRARASAPKDNAAWASGREWFRKANLANPQAVEPFYRYYTSFAWAGIPPPTPAVHGLMRASVLAPESLEIAVALARQKLRENKPDEARSLLFPVAFAPHRPRDDNAAKQVISLIDSGDLASATASLEALEVKWRNPD